MSPVPRWTPAQKVSFHSPDEVRDPMKEEASCWTEPSVDDLETWLEFQAGQLGTPMWWEELGAVPGIEDRHKFVWKIRAFFYVLEIWLRASPEQGYTAPPAPWILDRGAFHLEKFTYQDVRQQPVLLTIAYARCLQHWAEKQNLPRNLDFCPWVEWMRELWQTMQEFVNITYWDVMQGLEIEKSEASHPQLGATIFSTLVECYQPRLKNQKLWKLLLARFLPLLEMRLSGAPLHPQDLSKVIDTCWSSLLRWTN